MTRDMFLQELRIALQGRIPQVQVNEQLRYYENYIIEESRKGRTEEDVMVSLGSPRLIAKTIVQMSGEAAYQDGQEEEPYKGTKEKGTRKKRILSGIFFVLFLVLLIRIGIILLPLMASVFMVGAMVYVIFLIFFGNKK